MTGSASPLYMQIAARLESDIRSGILKAGDRVASERDLAETMGVSRMTARQAVRRLVDRGILEARAGQGSFVGASVIEQALRSLTGFTEEMSQSGRKARSIVVSAETRQADAQCIAALSLPAQDRLVHRLVRIRLADGVPIARETTDIRASVTPGLLDLANFETASLYETLRGQFGLLPASAEQSLAASLANGEAARSLDILDGAAVLKLTRLTYDSEGVPFEYVRSIYRGDAFVMRVALTIGDEKIQ